MITIRFSPTEVESCGLPRQTAIVEYDDQLRLHSYSAWLDKQTRYETGIDKLVALADQRVYH